MTTNAQWHKRHRMPTRASLEERIEWHVAHAAACACRVMPVTILRALKARDIALPRIVPAGTRKRASRRRATTRAS
jgi:hypothetical protein